MRKIALLLTLSIVTFFANAQSPFDQKIPNDPDVRIGKLDNGMSYYIAKNVKPENMAEFYIVHHVGAMQEEDNQNGLAHFLEHMAFNGTKHYPDKGLLEYLQTIGLEFGRNINAYTSQEETVYMLSNVPMTRETIIDSALLVLNDWSHYISLEDEEIDNERGVILEEMRTGMSAPRRLFNKTASTVFNNTKYADRLIIGTEDILKNFKYEDIRNFYHDWYRTDNQAVIAVGDFDVDKVEAKIKALFSQIPSVENAKAKEFVPISPYKQNVVKIVTDPEQTYTMATIMTPVETIPIEHRNSLFNQILDYNFSVMSDIINERFSDIAQQPDAPFLNANVGISSRSENSNMFIISVVTKEGELEKGVKAAVEEVVRVRKFGFSEDALERVKTNDMKGAEVKYGNRESRKSSVIVQDIISNFLVNDPILSPQVEYDLTKQMIESTTIEQINNFIGLYSPEVPSAVIVYSPEKSGVVPDGESVLAAYESALKADVKQLVEDKIDKPLIENIPDAIKVKRTETDKYGDTVWKLSNGATVTLRTTDFKKDELIISGSKKGGEALLSDDDMIAAAILPSVVGQSGLGDFSKSDMRKVMAGKSAGASVSFANNKITVNGSSSISDVETMLQLIYLRFTNPRFSEDDLSVVKSQLKSQFENMSSEPMVAYNDSVSNTLYGKNHPRIVNIDRMSREYDKVTLDQLKNIYSALYSGVDGMNFYFVGNYSKEQLLPLVEKYIATLPKGSPARIKDAGIYIKKGEAENIFNRKQENPKAAVSVVMSTDKFDYTLENRVALAMLRQILTMRYTQVIREEKGATYGVSVSSKFEKDPKSEFSLTARFDTNGEQAKEMADIISSEIEKIVNEGPREDDMQRTKEIFAKNFKNSKIENNAWLEWMSSLAEDNIDMYNDYEKVLSSIDGEKIKAVAKELISSGNRKKIIMMP